MVAGQQVWAASEVRDSKESISLAQCEDMVQNYLATGIGQDYLKRLLGFKNLNKQLHQACSNVLQDSLTTALEAIEVDSETQQREAIVAGVKLA